MWLANTKSIFFSYSSVPGVFGNQQSNYLSLIKQMLQQSVLDPTNYEVSSIFCAFKMGEHDTQNKAKSAYFVTIPSL